MSGFDTIQRIHRLEETAARLGFMITAAKFGQWTDNHNAVGLKPKDAESLPLYSRDAEIFTGSLEELEVWFRGIAWARDYDSMIKVSDDKKRARKEQDMRNYHTMQRLKRERVEQKG